jgi:hypothetical protein
MKTVTPKKKESNVLTITVPVVGRYKAPPQRGKVHRNAKAYNRRNAKKIDG